jgi:hypothetical protein
MDLQTKIKTVYPQLTEEDFMPTRGTIRVQNDSDGKGDYIKFWNHPSLTRPTDEELA